MNPLCGSRSDANILYINESHDASEYLLRRSYAFLEVSIYIDIRFRRDEFEYDIEGYRLRVFIEGLDDFLNHIDLVIEHSKIALFQFGERG